MGVIIVCAHCGTPTTSKFCKFCKTADQRREMDKANDENVFKATGKHYVCEYCTSKERQKEIKNKLK